MTELEIIKVPLDQVRVLQRIRQSLGDLGEMKVSMQARGLINPIVVRADGQTLLAGERRLAAASQLGWTDIDARVWHPADGLELLDVEAEENLARKQLTPGEAARARAMRRELADEAARERHAQAAASERYKATPEPYIGSGNFPDPIGNAQPAHKPYESGDARDLAARGTGYSGRTLDKVDQVQRLAEDQAQPDEVRKEAQQQYEQLLGDPKAKAERALRAVRLAQKRAERAAARQEQVSKIGMSGQWVRPPDPVAPDPTLTQRLIKSIGTVRGLKPIAIEIEVGTGLDLDDSTIRVLRKSLADQNSENTALSRALMTELNRRKDTQ